MKRFVRIIALMAVVMVFAVTCTAGTGGQIVIKMKDGTNHIFLMSEVEYIQYMPESSVPVVDPITAPGSTFSYIAGIKLPFQAGKIIFADELDEGLGVNWDKLEAVGGNYSQFAKFAAGDLNVVVPAGNSWGNTGIMSKKPLFTVTAAEKDAPYTIFVKLNPAATSSFAIAVSAIADPNVWGRQNAWFAYTPAANKQDSLYTAYALLNTQSAEKYGTDGSLGIKDEGAPLWVAFRVYTGKVELYLPNQQKPYEIKLGWLKEASPIYLHLFTALRNIGDPAKLSIDGVFVAK